MKDLHVLPKFADRWSHLYLEHGRLEQEDASLAFYSAEGKAEIPVCQLGLLMLGPGTAVTHQAMKVLADNNCLVCWTGEQGVRMYAHSTGGTHHSRRLLRQAELYGDLAKRTEVVRRMYQKRFPEPLAAGVTIEQLRGMEGARVRRAYQDASRASGVPWEGRNYDQGNWDHADPVNRALSAANACLYGLSHAAIVSAGYSPAIGFIHTGKMLSFVYDVADLYKTALTIPVAFGMVAQGPADVERRVRLACRDAFYESRLLQRILPDIAEVLGAPDDLGESPDEFEGRIVTLADRTPDGGLYWEPDSEGPRRAVAEGGGPGP
jgi:CRISPR-associated protein Cas1